MALIEKARYKRGASSQPDELQESEGRVSELEIQEMMHMEVLKCLVKLVGVCLQPNRSAIYFRALWRYKNLQQPLKMTQNSKTTCNTFCFVVKNVIFQTLEIWAQYEYGVVATSMKSELLVLADSIV